MRLAALILAHFWGVVSFHKLLGPDPKLEGQGQPPASTFTSLAS
jgi:hypothetical protein